jgi:hypothetical protein
MSQLNVVRCPELMLPGLVVKALIVGGAVGPCWVEAGAAGSCLTMVMQPAVKPIKATSDMAISGKYHLHFIIQASGFCGHYRCGWNAMSNKIKNQKLKIKMSKILPISTNLYQSLLISNL